MQPIVFFFFVFLGNNYSSLKIKTNTKIHFILSQPKHIFHPFHICKHNQYFQLNFSSVSRNLAIELCYNPKYITLKNKIKNISNNSLHDLTSALTILLSKTKPNIYFMALCGLKDLSSIVSYGTVAIA